MAKQAADSSTAPDALELLKSDHEQVLQLFTEFSQMEDDEEDSDNKRDLVEKACALLTIHAQIEEELFYPALRDVFDDDAPLDEAQVEHDIARQLIAEIEAMDADEDLYDAKFTVLGEYVHHHIEEEQNELFPKAKKAKIDLQALGADLQERKQELMDEIGMTPDDEETPHPTHAARTKSGKKHVRRTHA